MSNCLFAEIEIVEKPELSAVGSVEAVNLAAFALHLEAEAVAVEVNQTGEVTVEPVLIFEAVVEGVGEIDVADAGIVGAETADDAEADVRQKGALAVRVLSKENVADVESGTAVDLEVVARLLVEVGVQVVDLFRGEALRREVVTADEALELGDGDIAVDAEPFVDLASEDDALYWDQQLANGVLLIVSAGKGLEAAARADVPFEVGNLFRALERTGLVTFDRAVADRFQ